MTRTDSEPMRVDTRWRARYQANGIALIELQSPPPLKTRWPEVPTMRVSEIAAPVLMGFDVVYFQDWGNAAFHLVRERRCSTEQGPVCITVLHGPSEWELMSNERYPKLPDDLHLAYQEQYSARHSDFVVSPSCYMAEHLRERGWEFPSEVEILGLPMPVPLSIVAKKQVATRTSSQGRLLWSCRRTQRHPPLCSGPRTSSEANAGASRSCAPWSVNR